jgi:hypothetical protein
MALAAGSLMSWPEALELLSAELGEPVTFRVAAERPFRESDTRASRSPDPRKPMPVSVKTSNQSAVASRTAASGT